MKPISSPVVCVVPGDLHLTEPDRENHRTALRMVQEVNDLIRPDFVQFIGDNVQDATDSQFRLFRELTSRLVVPWYAVPGDHDVHDDPLGKRFRAHVGESYGAVSLRGFRFLRLDTQQARPLGLSSEQVDWFGAQVDSALAVGERVVVFQHNYPYQIWEDFAGPGIDRWRAIVQTRRIAAIFTGHTHYGQVANDGRNVVVATRSIGDPEGGAPGYLLIYLHGDDLAIRYRSIIDKGPIALITHPRERLLALGPAHVVKDADVARVRVWSAAPVTKVESQIDDAERQAFSLMAPGEYALPLAGSRLTKGEHFIEVHVADSLGNASNQRISFAVDPTGRYTAVPDAQPRVASTAFC